MQTGRLDLINLHTVRSCQRYGRHRATVPKVRTKLLVLGRALYMLYHVKYIDLVALAAVPGSNRGDKCTVCSPTDKGCVETTEVW